jgi:NhaP-type Na+/H+ or K+/H+ antiporter
MVDWRTYEKVATQLDSVETIISILILIVMGGVLGFLYYKFRKSTSQENWPLD